MIDQQTVHIEVYDIIDFVKEATERGISRIYRASPEGRKTYEGTRYTAFDFERNVFIGAEIEFPEITALTEFDLGDRYRNWTFEADAHCKPSSKRRFTRALKALGVPQDIIRQYASPAVTDLATLTDSSELEDDGLDIITIHRKGGVVDYSHPCSFMGCIDEIRTRLEFGRGGSSLDYKIIIPNWKSIYKELCDKYEGALRKFDIVNGSISVR